MAEKIPKRSRNTHRKEKRKASYNRAQKAKEQRIKEQKEREKANREHAKTDPLGLTAYQRRKFDDNMQRILAKYGRFRPGVDKDLATADTSSR